MDPVCAPACPPEHHTGAEHHKMSLSSETKDGITTITVDYPYYTSLRIKKYFQHHDQAGAEAAAHEFLENSAKRGVKHITSSVTHNEARQHYLAVYTMKERG